MAVHTRGAETTQSPVAAASAPAAPLLVHRSFTDLADSAAPGRTQRPAPGRLEGLHAAASVMGWVLWFLMALTMAAFLSFAPLMS